MSHRSVPLILSLIPLIAPSACQAAGPEAEIGKVAERYFAAYAAKDLDAFMELWWPRSSDFKPRRQLMKRIFAETREIRLQPPTIVQTEVKGEAARVRVRAPLAADDVRTGKPYEPFAWPNRVLYLVRENGAWKVSREVPAESDLLRRLLATKAEADRKKLCQEEKDLVTPKLVNAANIICNRLVANRQLDPARRINELAFEIAEGLADKGELAWCHFYRAALLQAQTRNPEALADLERARTIFREIKDRSGEAFALTNLSMICNSLGRQDESLQHGQAVRAIRRELADRPAEADALFNLGILCRSMGRYDEALRHYEECRTIRRSLHDRAGEAAVLHAMGSLDSTIARFAEAEQHVNAALELRRELGDRAGEAATRNILGEIYRSTGKYVESLQQHENSLKITRALGDRKEEANTLNDLGSVCWVRGDYPQALRHYQDSLTIERQIRDRASEAGTLTNMGSVCGLTGRYAEALRHYQDSLKIQRELGDRMGEAATRNNIGEVYRATGQYAEALRQHEDSLPIIRQLGLRAKEATLRNNLGAIHYFMGRRAEALQQFNTALAMRRELGDRQGEAASLSAIGVIYYDRGRYAEAQRQFEDCLRIERQLGDRAGEAEVRMNIGSVQGITGRYAEALASFEAGLKLAESIGDLPTVLNCYQGIGGVHDEQKNWRKASAAYQQAIDHVERIRARTREQSLQTSFLAQHTSPYVGLARSLLELDQAAKALAVTEQAKARALVDVFRAGKADVRKSMTADERRQEQQRQERLTALTVELEGLHSRKINPPRQTELVRELERARQDVEEFRRELYLHLPQLQTRRAEFAPATLAELNRSLFADHPKLVVLSYLVTDKEILLFALTGGDKPEGPARLAVHRIEVEAKALAESVEQFRAACQKPGGGAPDGAELYRLLLAPVEEMLAGASPVAIVPDGVLHLVPFPALKDGEDAPYLMQRCAVSYAPSITALVKMVEAGSRRRKGAANSLLAVGISDFGRREQRLPAAEEEARTLARLFGAESKLLLGSEATRANVRAASAGRRYLHLATHGRLNEDSPLDSAIVLSRAGERDEGLLFGRDLLDEDLSAELVVLSACETGLGRNVNGEGMQGLTWAWFVAGVPSTIASQWSVADDSTARLMQVFYEQLKGGASKAEALRRAQLALLKDRKTRHPFYWAPFALTGDPW